MKRGELNKLNLSREDLENNFIIAIKNIIRLEKEVNKLRDIIEHKRYKKKEFKLYNRGFVYEGLIKSIKDNLVKSKKEIGGNEK